MYRYKEELKNKVYEECIQDIVDYGKVEELFKKGVNTFDLEDYLPLYSMLIREREFDDDTNPAIENITKLFIKYGMVIKPKYRRDYEKKLDSDKYNPFAIAENYKAKRVIKMIELLMNDSKDFLFLISKYMMHLSSEFMIGCNIRQLAEYARIILYMLSYPYLLENVSGLRIYNRKKNKYDVSKFRNIDDYNFIIDTTNQYYPEIDNCGVVVKVYEKATNKFVWEFEPR